MSGGNMTEQATILIPDISGFTEFVTKTELDHSSHIINELLNLIINQNYSGFSLSEIEGDAILFYKKGDTLSRQVLVKQCMDMFSKFHEQLKLMERDVICRCGACQSASQLSLKFIIHYGAIKEFKIANIIKASGVDMIIAHRLLKNSINSQEYILLSSSCIDCLPDRGESSGLKWITHTETYPAIGEIKLEYADLSDLKNKIPSIPERRTFIKHDGGDTLEIEINAPIEKVYQNIIDLDSIPDWMIGVIGIIRDEKVERIGTKHVCLTPEFEMDVELDYAEFMGDTAIIVNKFAIRGTTISGVGTDCLKKINYNKTLLTDTSIWNVPEDLKQEMLASMKMSLELFKSLCEGKETAKTEIEVN
jgi:hypothetical protein